MLFMRKIKDLEEFERLWREGRHPTEIARHYGVTRPAIYRAANRHNLGKRGPLPPETLDFGPMTIEAELAFTYGKYALLQEIATREGWTQKKMMQAYYRAIKGLDV